MRYFLPVVLVSLIVSTITIAQNARVKQYKTPLAGVVLMSDISGNKYSPLVHNIEMPEPDGNFEEQRLDSIKKLIAQKYPHRINPNTAHKTTSVLPPTISVAFRTDSNTGIPSDNYVAVNKNDTVISVANTLLTNYRPNGAGVHATYTKNLQSLSTEIGLQSSTESRFDPKVIYDPEADRFICIFLNLNFNTTVANPYYSDSYIIVGFSQSSNPNGAWNFYKFVGDFAGDTTYFDYPCISITHNEFFITGNKVKNGPGWSWQNGFKESVIYQVRKQDGYNGDSTLNYQIWDSIMYAGTYVRNVYPLKGSGSISGPSQYLLGNRILDMQNDTVFFLKIPDTIGSSNNNLVVTALISNIPYGVPPNGTEPDTSVVLMTNDGRILGGYLENNEIQFVSTTIDTNNGNAAIYHGTISNYATSPVLTAQIFSIDTLDLGFPNLSYTGNSGGHNQSIISFDYTGPHRNPGLGAIFYDGSQYSPMLNIQSGYQPINIFSIGATQRWGDYSGSQPDWSAIGCVWVAGIFGANSNGYGNYIAKLASPFYVAGVNNVSSVARKSLVYPNPARQIMQFVFELDKGQVVSFAIYNMNGQLVDKLLRQYCKEGGNTIQFDVAPLASGTYFLKAADDAGKTISVNTFVRQ